MDHYLEELTNIYNIETKLEKKIFGKIEDELYDDSFVSQFKQAFLSLTLEHIEKLDYQFTDHEPKEKKSTDKLINKISKVQALRKSIGDLQFDNFKQEFYMNVVLKETFNIILNKYDSLNIKNKYAMTSDRLSYEFITDKSVIINKLPQKNLTDTLLYDFLSATIAEKFSFENINYILNVIDKVKKGNNLVLYIYFAPHIQLMNNLYLLLAHIFSSIDIYFPLNLTITNNKAIFVCQNKVNTLKNINQNKIINIEIKSNLNNEKMIKFELEIFKFIKHCFELFLYLIMIKDKDELKYNIIKYKILYKIYPKMLYLS